MEFFGFFNAIIENTAAAVIGATLSGAIILGVRRAMELAEEHKYSLAGEYKSSYGDLVDGEALIQRDTVTLKQRGLKITGEQVNHKTNRGWKLKGQIDRVSGHLYGFYKAKGHTDAGLGVFIFEQKPGGALEGLWADYDSQNKTIESGEYTLQKHVPVRVREAQPKDMTRILQLACQGLGDNYLDIEDFQKAPHRYVHVAESEGRIQGFALSERLDKDTFQTLLKGQDWPLPADIKQADRSGKIGVVKSVVIDAAFQKKGAGMKLVQKSLLVLEKEGVDIVCSIAWKTESVRIEPILLASDFVQRAAFKEFWSVESAKRNYDCPHCGSPPCHCEAILFIKNV